MASPEKKFLPPSLAAPLILQRVNALQIERLREELELSDSPEAITARCADRQRLCELLSEINPQNPTWRYGVEFFATFPDGPEAIWNLFDQWGILGDQNQLIPPEELVNVQPREIMDLDPLTLEKIFQEAKPSPRIVSEIKRLAAEGVEACWRQYHLTKDQYLRASRLDLIEIAIGLRITFPVLANLIEKEGVAKKHLLADDFVREAVEMAKKYNNLPLLVQASSADEFEAFSARYPDENLVLAGIAKGYSSILEKMIDAQKVQILPRSKGEQINLRELSPGNYLSTKDFSGSLPFADNSACVVMMNGLHHNTPEQQQIIIQEMIRVAFKPSKGRAAVLIVEPHNSQNLLRMVLEANLANESSGFDALFGTTGLGSQTIKSFIRQGGKACPEINWRASLFPSLPPIKPFQSGRICYQQVALKAA